MTSYLPCAGVLLHCSNLVLFRRLNLGGFLRFAALGFLPASNHSIWGRRQAKQTGSISVLQLSH
jgi:hypothetical protein